MFFLFLSFFLSFSFLLFFLKSIITLASLKLSSYKYLGGLKEAKNEEINKNFV
jgi:hypothetical protein